MTVEKIKKNFLASVVVFLVAIPLCLGIALASGASLFSGIITGCIGGVIVGAISASRVSVSGPAAGMVAVVLAIVAQLGSFDAFLLALFLAGILQIIGGVFRGGFIANYVPATVVKGLLAAIGLTIVIKQIPLAVGYLGGPFTPDEMLKTAQENGVIRSIPHLLSHVNIGAALISIFSFMVLIFWEKIPLSKIKNIPSAIVVVILGIIINLFYEHFWQTLLLPTTHLVNIPVTTNLQEFFSQFKHPDFSALNNEKVYFSAVMIAIVASLETLLNLEAIEKIDKQHRYCSRNRELVAQGIGNVCSSLIGGLPITSVIVRSSVNINAGGNSKLSTIFHGLLLLISLTFMARWLNYIPIAALATILIFTGLKLAKLSLFIEVYKKGMRYFIPFIVTIIAILWFNLLMGILIGLATSILFILQRNSKNCFSIIDEKHPSGDVLRLVLPEQATFLNRAGIIEGLNNLPRNAKVILDATSTDYIDEDIIDILNDSKDALKSEKNILFNFEGFQEHYDLKQTKNFIQVTTYDVQASLTPAKVLTLLREGNLRFVKGTPIHRNYKQEMAATSASQHPIAVILSCIDSRVPVELIFNLSLGDVFVIRIAGNIANDDILGSVEFACHVAKAKLIMVLGHKNCGAIKAACDDFHLGHLTQLIDKIKPAIELSLAEEASPVVDAEFLLQVTRNNVQLTKEWLIEHSAILQDLLLKNEVGIVGGLYDIATGEVQFDDDSLLNTNDSMPEQRQADGVDAVPYTK